MQTKFKKAGAILGSALMLGTTLVGAALASETVDLGQYDNLMVNNGEVASRYVVGANANTADVVTAMEMTAWLGSQTTNKEISPEITVTSGDVSSGLDGITRHIELDKYATTTSELGQTTSTYEVLAPSGYASGENVVSFLKSSETNSPIYVNNHAHKWHESIKIDLSKIRAARDDLDSHEGERYDEVFLQVENGALTYKWEVESAIDSSNFRGKKITFMGEEYSVISISDNIVKLGSVNAEMSLTTGETQEINGASVKLDGIYTSGSDYKAKITVTNDGTTESAFVDSGTTEVLSGIEVFVKNAVVSTLDDSGAAQMVVGAGIYKIQDGEYLKKGDGTETNWIVTKYPSTSELEYMEIQQTGAYTSHNKALTNGDELSLDEFFKLYYTGMKMSDGSVPDYRNVNVYPENRVINGVSTDTIRVRTSDNRITLMDLDSGTTEVTNEIWVNTSADNLSSTCIWRQSDEYTNCGSPKIVLSTGKELVMNWNITNKALSFHEPELISGASHNFTLEYEDGKFQDTTAPHYYAYMGDYTASEPDGSEWFGRNPNEFSTSSRDYITQYGTYINPPSQYQFSFSVPTNQLYGRIEIGSPTGVIDGETTVISSGETVNIGDVTLTLESSADSSVPITLPNRVAILDTEVSSEDKGDYNLVLIGGPAVNILVNELQASGKLIKTIGSPGEEGADINQAGSGIVQLIDNAWGTNKYAIVVAGSDREGTQKAGEVLAQFNQNKGVLDGKTHYEV